MTFIEAESPVELSADVARDLHVQALAEARRSAIVRTLVALVAIPMLFLLVAANLASAFVLAALVFPLVVGAGVSIRAYLRRRAAHPLESFQRDVEENARLQRFQAEHEIRLAAVRPWMSYALGASLVVLFFVENQAGSLARVVARTGFVRAAVLDGEWWRLLTAACVHASPMHLLGNLSALVALGTLIEAYDRRMRVPAVYLAAAIAGSVASLLLTDKSGLGASGGIMGLAGFLMVRALQGRLPGPIGERVAVLLGGTAFVGVIGYRFIGNAAHAGGALAGAAIALLTRGDDPQVPDAVGDGVGWASTALLALASLYTGIRLAG